MRLPLPSPFLCASRASWASWAAAFAIAFAGELAFAKPRPMEGKRWRFEQVEDYKPDETYKAPPSFRDNSVGSDRQHAPQYMPQSDAFETAAEHAVYAQAYQMYYGPYGRGTPEQENKGRGELLKKTALAIENCVSGGPCGASDQQLILKALVNYNYGQELKRINLVNMTNKEKIRSLVAPDEQLPNDQTKAMSIQQRGSSVANGQRRDAGLSIVSGTARDPYFQLPIEDTRGIKVQTKDGTRKTLSPKDIEALGPDFVKEYRDFVKLYSAPDRNPNYRQRYYKYVAARENSYVFDPNSGEQVTDDKRLADVIREQNNPNIQKYVDEHIKADRSVQIIADKKDGKDVAQLNGNPGAAIGLGELGVAVMKTGPDGKPTNEPADDNERFSIMAGNVNKLFKDAAEKRLKGSEGQGRDIAQAGASMYAGQSPKEMADTMRVGVTLEPARFDAFLNEIWPSSAERQKIIKGN